MAFTAGLFTSLALWGAPGPTPTALEESGAVSDTASVSVSESAVLDDLFGLSAGGDSALVVVSESASVAQVESQITGLELVGVPWTYNDLGAKTTLAVLELDVVDGAAVTTNEDPVDGQLLETSDSALVTATEAVDSVAVDLVPSVDAAAVLLSEAVSISIAGSFDLDLTDSALSVLVEALALDATSDVTDSALVLLTELSQLDIDVAATTFDASDSALVLLSESAALLVDPAIVDVTDSALATAAEIVVFELFTGAIEMPVQDDGPVSLTESTTLVVIDGRIGYLTGTVSFVPALTGVPSLTPGD